MAGSWPRRVRADLASSAPAPAAPGRHVGYLAVTKRDNGKLAAVGAVTRDPAAARRDAAWWSVNDKPGAFVVELREVTR